MLNHIAKGLIVGLAALALSQAAVSAAELKKVAINFGLNYPPVGNGPIFSVPKAMGFWEEEGLDVEVQFANGVGSAVQQLIANKVVATFGGLPPSIQLINSGAPIVIVGGLSSKNTFYPVALASSDVKTVDDMKGRNIGITSASSSNVFFIKAMLLDAGIDPDKDVTLVSVGSGPAAIQALTSGKIDVLQLSESAYDQMELMGYPLRKFDDNAKFKDLTFTFGVTTRPDLIADEPDVLVGLLRGMAKGMVWSEAHPEDAVKAHWQLYPLSRSQGKSEEEILATDVALLKSGLEARIPYEGKFTYASERAVKAMVDALVASGELKEALPIERYYDSSLVDRINDFDHEAIKALPPKF